MGRRAQNSFMPGTWYRRKSEECGRLAKSAKSPQDSARYEQEEKLWLRIADDADAYAKAERDWEASRRRQRDPK
jgi:hypothetical protein